MFASGSFATYFISLILFSPVFICIDTLDGVHSYRLLYSIMSIHHSSFSPLLIDILGLFQNFPNYEPYSSQHLGANLTEYICKFFQDILIEKGIAGFLGLIILLFLQQGVQFYTTISYVQPFLFFHLIYSWCCKAKVLSV